MFGAGAGAEAEAAVARRVREVAAQLGERVRAEMRVLPMPTCGRACALPCGRLFQSLRGGRSDWRPCESASVAALLC